MSTKTEPGPQPWEKACPTCHGRTDDPDRWACPQCHGTAVVSMSTSEMLEALRAKLGYFQLMNVSRDCVQGWAIYVESYDDDWNVQYAFAIALDQALRAALEATP